jgi:hypothetical protein
LCRVALLEKKTYVNQKNGIFHIHLIKKTAFHSKTHVYKTEYPYVIIQIAQNDWAIRRRMDGLSYGDTHTTTRWASCRQNKLGGDVWQVFSKRLSGLSVAITLDRCHFDI